MIRSKLAAAIVATLTALAAGAQQPELPTRALTAGVHLITAEIASEERTREMGLMYRRSLQPNHGMLFVFDPAEKACMWMRNTLLPLSVAFIEADGRILNIEDMEPRTDQIHCARGAVPYALEMVRGWFAERGLKAGETIIGGLPRQASASK
jgi:uncharacterized protein